MRPARLLRSAIVLKSSTLLQNEYLAAESQILRAHLPETDGGGAVDQPGRAQNDSRNPARSHRERDCAGEPLSDLMNCGLDFTQPRLYVLDGGKALHAAVKNHAGESALIQRCQVHKRRNVLDHLPDDQKPLVATRLNAAYALGDYAAARQALQGLHAN